MAQIKLGISTCLLGEKVRYDGQYKLNHYLKDQVGQFVSFYPVCPEADCGLSIPREAMRLVGDIDNPRLMTQKTGIDHTDRMNAWMAGALDQLETAGISGFVFKSKSPSSGMERVKVYNESGMPSTKGVGLFARGVMERFPLMPVEEEGRLNDNRLRENFIERLYVYYRWQQLVSGPLTVTKLMDFHKKHKLIIMAHSPKVQRDLGKLIGTATKATVDDVYNEYISMLMPALKLIATAKKNTNVLHHIIGYFKKFISADEKQELVTLID
ncbi:hypothetical protein BVX99_00690, partial [bacterium F16]